MKTIFIITTLLLSIDNCFGQTDTIFFNSDWMKCDKIDAKFYRTIIKDKDQYIISDMHINNKPQMIAICSNSTDPLNKNGECAYFDDNGNIESKGSFKNNRPTGTWTWFDDNSRDSTIAEYREDGTKSYLRFSKVFLENQKVSADTYQMAEEMPIFPGGPESLNEFLATEFKIPKADTKKNTKGTFYAVIIINEDGSVSLSEIKKSLSTSLDDEARRVIKKMPNWSAGRINEKTVKVTLTIPFKIN